MFFVGQSYGTPCWVVIDLLAAIDECGAAVGRLRTGTRPPEVSQWEKRLTQSCTRY